MTGSQSGGSTHIKCQCLCQTDPRRANAGARPATKPSALQRHTATVKYLGRAAFTLQAPTKADVASCRVALAVRHTNGGRTYLG